MRWVPLAVVIGAVMAPLVVAQDSGGSSEELEFRLDVDRFVLVTRAVLVGADAAEMRHDIDEDYGNGDGVVTQDEVEALRADRYVHEVYQPECFSDFRLVTLDGWPPVRLALIEQDAFGALGRTSSMAPLVVTVMIHFEFNTTAESVAARVDLKEMDDLGVLGCVFLSGFDWGDWTDAWAGWGSGWGGYDYSGPYGGYPPGCCRSAGIGFGPLDLQPRQQQEQPPADEGDGQTFRFTLRAADGAAFEEHTIHPAAARTYWDGRAFVADDEAGFAALAAQPIMFRVTQDATTSLSGQAAVGAFPLALGAAGGAALVALLVLTTEYGRWALLRWFLWFPGFTRLEKDEVLKHDRRSDLYSYIKQNPGATFTELQQATELANGALVHHLRVLENQEFVRPIRDGFRTRFYMRGPRIDPEPYLSRTQQHLLDTISANPGVTQKELARLVGLPRESVSYHANRLAQHGKVQVQPDGRWRKYFVPRPPGIA